jgi:hypothetical protein
MSFRLWLRDLANRTRLDQELEQELNDHIERDIANNIAHGMSAEEARRTALLTFGQVQHTREQCRSERHGQFLESILQDVHFAFRMLRRNGMFTAIAVATLAIGIGPTQRSSRWFTRRSYVRCLTRTAGWLLSRRTNLGLTRKTSVARHTHWRTLVSTLTGHSKCRSTPSQLK